MQRYFPKLSELSPDARAALTAQQHEQRQKELADSRQVQREKVARERAAEARALQERLQRPRGPGRPRKNAHPVLNINVHSVSINCANLNVVNAGLGMVINQQSASVSSASSKCGITNQFLQWTDGKEGEPESQADEWEILAEEEQCDEENAVEEDEEEVDMDVSIAACLESRVIPQGVRRSSRLAARGDVLRDLHMAALLQEQVYVDGCAEE